LVIGGLGNDPNDSYPSTVEVINLADDNKLCPSIPDYPIGVEQHTAVFYQGKIVSCGGYADVRNDRCFELGPDLRSWVEINSLPIDETASMQSSVIDGKWVISGGDTDLTHTSLLSYYDGIFQPSPPLPFEKWNHCQLTLNSTHIFFTGGYGYSTFMLNWPRQEWIFLDDAPRSDTDPACGFVKTPSLGQEVIVAFETRSYIFSLADLEWRDGPLLPEDLSDFTNAQLNNGFLAIGGFNSDNQEVDTIYRFDPNSYDWVLEPSRLAIPRRRAEAVAVPDDFLACV